MRLCDTLSRSSGTLFDQRRTHRGGPGANFLSCRCAGGDPDRSGHELYVLMVTGVQGVMSEVNSHESVPSTNGRVGGKV